MSVKYSEDDKAYPLVMSVDVNMIEKWAMMAKSIAIGSEIRFDPRNEDMLRDAYIKSMDTARELWESMSDQIEGRVHEA